MNAAISAGREASDAWLASSVMTFLALSRVDIMVWLAGAIILSSLEIWYHDGLAFHAGTAMVSPKVLATGAFWGRP